MLKILFKRLCMCAELTMFSGLNDSTNSRVFGKINFVTNQLGEVTMAVDIVHKPQKKCRSFGEKLPLGRPFSFYKGNPKNIQRKICKRSVLALITHIMVQSI